EGGTTPALGAVVNAVVDALSEFGVKHIEMPVTPERVWRSILWSQESNNEPGTVRHSRDRHDAQPGRPRLRPDARFLRRRRDQAGGTEGRRRRAYQHARSYRQRQPVLPGAERQQA